MLTSHDIEILTIASFSAPHGSEIGYFVPPVGEPARLAARGWLRVATVQRATIDRGTGRAQPYADRVYEPTASGELAVERAVRDGTLSEEARRLLAVAPDVLRARPEPAR